MCAGPGVNAWYRIVVAGAYPAQHPGAWHVDVYIKDYFGNYENKFTDNFTIQCVSAGDCDDGNPCTDDLCSGGNCQNPNNSNACADDGNACTNDVCSGGSCAHPPNTAPCNDGQFCNGTDTCSGGSCSVHTGNPCTDGPECADSCNEGADNCYDSSGTPCTDDGNECTDDVCNGSGGCTHPPNTAPCDDGQFCNGADTCSGGSCSVHGGDPCIGGSECDDSCNEGADNCYDPSGTPCTDDGNACTDDECDGSGSCAHPNKPDDTPCDDGNPDTCPDKCAGGVCTGPECVCEFTIGGAIYTDLGDPLGTGAEGVTVCATCNGVFNDCAVTSGGQGLWQIGDVPCGPCEIMADKTGCTFQHVVGGVPGDSPPISITVDAPHLPENQSIQFLAACCGDGEVGPGEECDDGNTDDCDGCRGDCSAFETGCGDGFVCGTEACDDGNNTDCDGCRADCSAIETGCGDGFICGVEVCDDGNNMDCDGCRADCSATETGCGDGFVCGAEACDDGNNDDCDGCRGDCSAIETGCGDGFVCGIEECDDGNTDVCDGCDANCVIESCGDSILCESLGEECDDGNTAPCDGCDATCVIEFCGDGVLCEALGEECDDGNNIDGDGCSANCIIEPDGIDFEYECVVVGAPSTQDQTPQLPVGLTAVGVGDTFYVEFWATDSGDTNTGVVSAYADLDYPEGLVMCEPPTPIQHSGLFPLFTSGACDGSIVDELGGSQLSGGVGVEPEWARVADVQFIANAFGTADFCLGPAVAESSAYNRGLVLPSDIEFGCCSVEIAGCRCVYDLDNNCTVAGGDLGLFAGCWLCCDTEPCWEENTCEDKDFDCNGCVAGGDLGWFAGAWLKSCDELDPIADYPGCRECDGPIVCPWPGGGGRAAGATAMASVQRPDDAEGTVKLALRLTMHQTGRSEIDPLSRTRLRAIDAGDRLYAEVWVRDDSPSSKGLTAVFADLLLDPAQFDVISIDPGQTFTLFAELGTKADAGVVRRIGGATMDTGVGTDGWVLVSAVELEALTHVSRPSVTLRPAAQEAVSRRGQGLVRDDRIEIVTADGMIGDSPKTKRVPRGQR